MRNKRAQGLIENYNKFYPKSNFFNKIKMKNNGEDFNLMNVDNTILNIQDCKGNIHKCYDLLMYTEERKISGEWRHVYFDTNTFEIVKI